MNPSILIAGVGNIFLGDDAFGVEVIRALANRPLPEGVTAVDYGIRGFDLAYALLDPWDAVVIVDALPRRGTPGTLYTLEPDLSSMGNSQPTETMINPHGMDPDASASTCIFPGHRPCTRVCSRLRADGSWG